MAILDNDTRRLIEKYFKNYYELKQEVIENRNNIILAGSSEIQECKKTDISDPTGKKALKLCDEELLEKEKWIYVIENAMFFFKNTGKDTFIKLNYFEGMNEIQVCNKLYISRTTYYKWKEDILIFAAMVAIQEGLIKISASA